MSFLRIKKIIILIPFLFVFFIYYGCGDNPEKWVVIEPNPELDPLANVIFRIESDFIIQGGISTDTLYNIQGKYIREGNSKDGIIKYTKENDFIYQGDTAKGKPIYLVVNNTIYNFSTNRALWSKDESNYFRETSGSINYPVSGNSGEVAFNIDGDYIRQGQSSSGNKFYLGRGASGSVVFSIDGDIIRKGNAGEILFTIKGNYLYKGISEEISFRISGNNICKGKFDFT